MKNRKPGTDVLEYSYLRSTFRKKMLSYFIAWLIIRIVRILLYVYTGEVYEPQLFTYMLTFLTGIVFGLAGQAIIVYRNSILAFSGVDKRE